LCFLFLFFVGCLLSAPAQVAAPVTSNSLSLAEALERYAMLTGRTVLRSADLPQMPNAITNQLPADTNLAAACIVSELARQSVELKPDGTMFARVLAVEKRTPALEAQLAALGPVPLHDPSCATNRILFPAIDLNTLLAFYSDLSGRTLLRPAALPAKLLQLQPQQPLTREEMIYALKTVLVINGVALVDDGARLTQVVPLGEMSRVQTNAPAPERGAVLIAPTTISVFAAGFDTSPLFQAPSSSPPPPPTVDRLVAYYASLTGRKAVASPKFGKFSVAFRAANSLTKPELLYALETTLALNNLAIVKVDDTTIRAGHISEGSNWPKRLPRR
jgi:hypothetical protein